MGRQGGGQPVLQGQGSVLPPASPGGHPLPGGPHQQGAAPHPQAAGVGQQGQVFLIVCAKAHPRVEAQLLLGKAKPGGILQAGLEKPPGGGKHLSPLAPQGAVYHAAAAGAGRRPEHLLPKAGDIVDDVGPGSQGLFRHLGVEGVHRQGHVQLPEKQGQHVFEAIPLLLPGHSREPRPGGLSPQIDDIRALGLKFQSTGQGQLRGEVPAPVGEGVRGHV